MPIALSESQLFPASEPATMARKPAIRQSRTNITAQRPTLYYESPRYLTRIGYGTSSMAQGVHDTWMEGWKAVCSATVLWHKACRNTWTKPDGWKDLWKGSTTGHWLEGVRWHVTRSEKIRRCRARA